MITGLGRRQARNVYSPAQGAGKKWRFHSQGLKGRDDLAYGALTGLERIPLRYPGLTPGAITFRAFGALIRASHHIQGRRLPAKLQRATADD